MKTSFYKYLFIVAYGAFLFSCSGRTGKLETERDSVIAENQRLNEFLDIVAFSMDSLNGQERFLYQDKEGKPITNKEQIRNNLRIYKYTLQEQQKRIEALEQQLKEADDERSMKLRAIITSMRNQLEEKNMMIAQLQEQLEQKNVDIKALRRDVGNLTSSMNSMTKEIEDLSEQNESKDQNLKAVNQELSDMSTGYVVIGTKKELINKGLLSGGFLKKKKAQLSEENNTHFKKIDIRSNTSFSIPGKNVKVITPQPSSSYSIQEDESQSTLQVTNSSQFWGASRYLIIQYK